jgi:DNA-binding beta-propeller fold protein YncE
MASSSQLCEPCFTATKSSVAVKYCSDCDELLCPDCFSVHGTFKAFMSHHVIDAQVSADKSFELDQFCSDHKDMVLDFYCSDHDDICCKSCIADEHRTCGKIKPLDYAAKGVKSATMFEDFASEVKYLIDTASKVREQKQKSKVTWDSSTDSVKRGIEIFRSRILKRIDDMEEKLMLGANTANSTIVAETQEEMKAVEQYMSDIQDILHKFDFIAKNESEKQIFRLIKSLETGLSQKSEDLEKLISSLTFPQLVFKESNVLSMMETIGSVTIETSPSDMNYQPPKALQAQTKNSAIKSAILNKFEFDSKIPFKCKHFVKITGIGVTRNDHLLLCNRWSNDVIVLSDDGKELNDIGLEGSPSGIVVVPDKEEAIVTLSHKNFIQIINTSTMRAEQKIMVPVKCYGITLIDNDILLGNRGVIHIINREGERLNTIKVGKGTMYSLYCGKDKTLYCCDADNHKFYGIKQDGTILFSFSSSEFRGPTCVAAAANGNLYVTAYQSHNVHCFTPDGKHKCIMLKKEDGLNTPYVIAFSKKSSKVFIVNYLEKSVLKFSHY